MAVFSVSVEPAHGRGDAGGPWHLGDARDDPAMGSQIRPGIRQPHPKSATWACSVAVHRAPTAMHVTKNVFGNRFLIFRTLPRKIGALARRFVNALARHFVNLFSTFGEFIFKHRLRGPET